MKRKDATVHTTMVIIIAGASAPAIVKDWRQVGLLS